MKLVTEAAAKYPSPRLGEAKLNVRSTKTSGRKAANRETGGETRTAGVIPPPLF